ncbi:hypothetical protein Rpal_3072 [Rhodopseudomonas palustris TIE-1]|uniref:hypothetical protein n=1 Tax=Rhodopseudomonas palustris TaxID=1076 RepID=UPI000164A549|nr:hypothetical protein [Rhodopseudomonas palustris]ACF01578.1 hypothetical protein Rpal_3072 [Rhodopseudomonas palustris TIE-1]
MAQASAVYTVPIDIQHGKSFRDLEGDIYDLSLMAKLASREIECLLDDVAAGTECYDRGTFVVQHLCDMIETIKGRYYAKYHAGS